MLTKKGSGGVESLNQTTWGIDHYQKKGGTANSTGRIRRDTRENARGDEGKGKKSCKGTRPERTPRDYEDVFSNN